MQNITDVKIRRFHFTINGDIQLHIFCNTCEEGIELNETLFVIRKSRIAPLKPILILRMELQAALMGATIA